MSLQRYSVEISAVTNWYDAEGKRAKYWMTNPLWPDEMMATKERIQLRNDVFVLIQYLEQEEICMAYHCADELKINLKNLVREMLGPGMVSHIARTRVHHIY
jgi:hypothetical protein